MNEYSLFAGKEYDFMKLNPHLGTNIILVGYGGSHAYGTAVEGSDIDIRGIALNSKREILLGRDFEQVEDGATDTVIYSLNKAFKLFAAGNPNMLELLGLEPEHYFYVSPIAREILQKKYIFLSKKIVKSYGGYIKQQTIRMINGNKNAIPAKKADKYLMHIVRLYYSAIDILEKKEINTYREKEIDLLLDIRNGKYSKEGQPTPEYWELISDLEKRFLRAKEQTTLPDEPDYEAIDELLASINLKTVSK